MSTLIRSLLPVFILILLSCGEKKQAMKIPEQDKLIEIIHGDSEPKYSVIWLHGLGATSDDFAPVVPHLNLDRSLSVRFVFPQAPSRSITVNNGMVMPGWYDIKGMSINDKEDLQGFAEANNIVNALVNREIERGIPSNHIILGGFSQGGAVAYYTGLRTDLKLAGIMSLSSYLAFAEDTKKNHSKVNLETSILAMHGELDNVVPVWLGQSSAETLKQLGFQVNWKVYPMQHNVIAEQIEDIGAWMNGIFLKN